MNMPVIISKSAQNFASEIVQPDAVSLWHIECGLHSGFPRCCIAFFVKVWWRVSDDNWKLIDSYRKMQQQFGVLESGYVMCPSCVLNKNVVEVKNCNCHRQRT